MVGDHQVGAASSDIQDQHAFIVPALSTLGGVEQRDGSNLHRQNFLAGILDHIRITGDLVRFDRNEQRLIFFMGIRDFQRGTVLLGFNAGVFPLVPDQLIIPHHLVHRVRDRLPGFIFHDFIDCALVAHQRRQLAQPGKRRLAGKRKPHTFGDKTALRQHFAIVPRENLLRSHPFLFFQLAESEFPQHDRSAGREDELSHLQIVSADVNR